MNQYEEQLILVRKAIADILLGAQEASYNGQRVRKADLSALQTREAWLIKQIRSESRTGIRVRYGVPNDP